MLLIRIGYILIGRSNLYSLSARSICTKAMRVQIGEGARPRTPRGPSLHLPRGLPGIVLAGNA